MAARHLIDQNAKRVTSRADRNKEAPPRGSRERWPCGPCSWRGWVTAELAGVGVPRAPACSLPAGA